MTRKSENSALARRICSESKPDFQEATFRFSASRGLPARAGWGVRIALYILMYIRVR